MAISYLTILKDVFTLASGTKILSGAVLHKIWQKVVAKFKAVEAKVVEEAERL